MHFPLLLALGSALFWGAGDFFGGLATRDAKAVSTTFISQFVGLFGLVLVCILGAGGSVSVHNLAWGTAAGLSAVTGLGLFYEALSRGAFGPVASITSVVSSAVPITVGVLLGERPSPIVFGGVMVAVIAIWLIAGERRGADDQTNRGASVLAVGAGAFFGGYFVLLSRAGGESGLWPLVAGRSAASIAVAFTIVVLRKRRAQTNWIPAPRATRLAAIAGVLDASANALYFLASRHGLLSVVAVIASMYPASTILLARLSLREKVNHRRLAGMAVGLVAVTVIAKAGVIDPSKPSSITVHAQSPITSAPSSSSIPNGLALADSPIGTTTIAAALAPPISDGFDLPFPALPIEATDTDKPIAGRQTGEDPFFAPPIEYTEESK